MTTRYAHNLVLLLLLAAGTVMAQTESDSVPPDTSRQVDTVSLPAAATIEDSIRMTFPDVNLDTLDEAHRLLLEFDTRFRMRQADQPRAVARSRMSFQDSLTTYFLPERWNLREDIDRSFYHDAGDYFRFDPGYFVLDPQATPLRKTVQPFGLGGDRTAFLIGVEALHPFEHVVEPDGMVDMNDIPTAMDHTVALLPGPVGLVFGADHSAATLFTLPERLDSTGPRSSFVVDKGSYAYSHARGRYSRDFTDGRHVDASLGYRNADGTVVGADDDAYQYTGNFAFPIGDSWDLNLAGQLYDRTGNYRVRPLANGESLERDRIDRTGRIGFSRYNAARDVRYDFGYRYLRQGSALSGEYNSNLNQTGHGLSISREWFARGLALRAEAAANHLKYDTWSDQYTRLSAEAGLRVARLTRPWGFSAVMKQSHVEDYGFLPTAALIVRRETARSLALVSVGYSERAPSMNELLLPYQKATLFYGSTNDYADQGNPGLVSEKMMDGTIQVSLGHPDNSLSVAATGGKIWDGIDWTTSKDGALTVFAPRNGDIDFAAVTAIGRLRLADFARFKGGASYNQVDYESVEDRAYAPDYRAFSGLELHLFWSQKLIDFYAYGELVYVGPYDGYVRTGLGDEVVTNVKLSFKMGHFRFHWILQNSVSSVFSPRDYWENPGYAASYGFVWDFFD